MADLKISQLTELTGANTAADDVLPIVDTNAVETKKIRADQLFKSLSVGTASSPAITPAGDQDTGIFFPASNTVSIATGGNKQFEIENTASAVNYVQATGSATGNTPTISAQGSDANVNLLLNPKGNSQLNVFINGGSQFRVSNTANAVNYLQAVGSIASNAPVLSSQGTDTNIDLTLTPKGTGLIRFGTHTGTADAAITGYIEIKDSSGNIRKLAIIN